MTSPETPRIRQARLADDAVLIVRGDVLHSDVLRTDAARFARRYPNLGWVGVSAYYAAHDAEIGALCESKLNRFATVVVFARTDLVAVGIEIVGTFRTPHVTLATRELDHSQHASSPAHTTRDPTSTMKAKWRPDSDRLRHRPSGRPEQRGRLRAALGVPR